MLRARPAIAFAPLNHILMSGFFFNQGFFIRLFLSSNLSCLIEWRASRPGRERASLPRVESSSRGAFLYGDRRPFSFPRFAQLRNLRRSADYGGD
jgi:hypothetical protein